MRTGPHSVWIPVYLSPRVSLSPGSFLNFRYINRGVVMDIRRIVGFALALIFSHPGYLRGVDSEVIKHYFSYYDLVGFQNLWAAWNTSTPHQSTNLLNWATWGRDDQKVYPCYNAAYNWRGVTCLRYNRNGSDWDTWVVGLELSGASIVGILPPGVKEFSKLVTLSLTGNPNLTGSLPRELADVPLNILDLHDNGFSGTIPSELGKLQNLLELDLSGNKFVGDFPTQFTAARTLQVFKIARNLLQGDIMPEAFENMTQLLILDLSGNKFTGPAPKFSMTPVNLYNLNLSQNNFTGLPELSQLFNGWLPKSLGVLDLSGLRIGGQLPNWNASSDLLSLEKLYLDNIGISGAMDIMSIQSSLLNLTKGSNSTSRTIEVLSLKDNGITDVHFDKLYLRDGQIKLYLQGNPYCMDTSKDLDGRRCFCEQYCAISPKISKKSYWKVIVITTTISSFLLGSVFLFIVFMLHRRNRHVHILLKRFEESDVRAKRFEYTELRAATKNFDEQKKLGQGAFGAVYKGTLTNNTEVAVKQLFMKTEKASEEFLNEVLLITNLQHRNLVALRGYCLHGKEMLLVYEFVDFCDLDKLLFPGPQGAGAWQVVSWPARLQICLGVAQGLYYLHASSQTKIIHRDIKASNILLDKNLNPKIADFGLARPMQDDAGDIMTQQRAGTLGYLAPEYMLYGQLSEKADVFSFGVLLLEIVSGSRNKDPTLSEDEVYLPKRACKFDKEDRLMDIMDPRLHVNKDEAVEVRRVLETAVMCVQFSPENRPTMFRVVAMLAGDGSGGATPKDLDYNSWPQFLGPSRTQSDNALLNLASSSTTGSNSVSKGPFTASCGSTGPVTNGNAVEMSILWNGR